MTASTRFLLAFLPALLLAGCASAPVSPHSNVLSTDVILRAESLTGAADLPVVDDVDVLALNDDMLAFIDEHVDPKQPGQTKVRALLHALLNHSGVGLEYDTMTRTAAETYGAGLGNCLSFTNMFVAMAREAGLNVTYQEVKIPPSWTLEGDTYVLSRHVNAVVDLGFGATNEVDFNVAYDDFEDTYSREDVSDARALAHYYSNIGVEYLQKDQPMEALRYFRKALTSDGLYAPGWSNLGVLFSRAGHLDYAEAAYVQALISDPDELVAMSNLGRLYLRMGRKELANWYAERSEQHRLRNPYYRYHLARKAFAYGDYDAAIEHLEVSVRERRTEGSFYVLMGLSYMQIGNEAAARKWLRKVERLAEDNERNKTHVHKLERLMSQRN